MIATCQTIHTPFLVLKKPSRMALFLSFFSLVFPSNTQKVTFLRSRKMADSIETFPAAEVKGELNPAYDKNNLKVDSASSEISTAIETKERNEVKKERERKETMQSLKKGIIVSAVLVAVAGAAFAIFKKLKEK